MKIISFLLCTLMSLFLKAGTSYPEPVLLNSRLEELCLWGVNFQPCLSWEYNSRLKSQGVELSDLHSVINNNLDDLVRMKVNMFRCHLTPSDFTDAEGNLVETPYIDALDYMIAKASERGISVTLAFLNHMGNYYVNNSFIIGVKREDWIHSSRVVKCSKNYISQLLCRVNKYTRRIYAKDDTIAYWELINEPSMYSWEQITGIKDSEAWHGYVKWLVENSFSEGPSSYKEYRKILVRKYIDNMRSLIRTCGSNHPVVWSHNWHRYRRNNEDIFDGALLSLADAFAFCNYPGQDNVPQDYWKNPEDLSSMDYEEWFNSNYSDIDGYGWLRSVGYSSRPKIVYEYETFFNQSSYLYPAQALYFRSLGVQSASMWTYCMNEYARFHSGSHFLNLRCTPAKAVSFIIAREIFMNTPRDKYYSGTINEVYDKNYLISKSRNLSVWSDDLRLYYAGDINKNLNIVINENVKEIIGIGNSPLVRYSGTGAYFINVSTESLEVTLMPDCEWVQNVWDSRNEGIVSRLDYSSENKIDICIPSWDNGRFIVWEKKEGGENVALMKVRSLRNLNLRPGEYIITKEI